MFLSRACPILALACAALAIGCGGDETALVGPTSEAGCPAPNRVTADGRCIEPGVQDNGCPAGTLGLEDGTCQPAGIPPEMCAAGFEPDGKQGCEPVLPAEPCPKGQMAVPGEANCRPVMPCAPGKWGDLPVDETTEHVDGSYAGGDSDGSAEKPWKTIGEALKAAAPGALVAVAAGIYAEDVFIKAEPVAKPVRLWGVCPDKVAIVGSKSDLAAVYIREGASGSEVGGLAITGGADGLFLSGSEDVVVDRVWVHDTADRGIGVQDDYGPTSIALRGSLAEQSHEAGVYVAGSVATIEGTVVRTTLPEASDQPLGCGISVQARPYAGGRGTLVLRGSLVEHSRITGVHVSGSDATIEGSVVRATLPQASDQLFGCGISVQQDLSTGGRGTLVLRGSLVEQNHEFGVHVSGSDATIESTVVRVTLPQASDQLFGRGINVQHEPATGERATLALRGSLVEKNHDAGVLAIRSDAIVEGAVVRATLPQASGQLFGWGVDVQDHPDTGERATLALRGSLVEQNYEIGVFAGGSDATIEGTVVRATLPRPSDQLFGRGINVEDRPETDAHATLALRGSLVEQNSEFGVVVGGLDVTVEGCRIANTLSNGFGRFGDGLSVFSYMQPASASISATRIEQSARAALSNFGASVTYGSTLMQCQLYDIDGETYAGDKSSFDHHGGSLCGCPLADRGCIVKSAGIEPPELAAPIH
ncbi:MAG: DUF1565 domain-containing protein [Deltaproteobacteria bacterium]|nr:DUF1565 domain-containing protein [Deltaproteobacteria bacterium]